MKQCERFLHSIAMEMIDSPNDPPKGHKYSQDIAQNQDLKSA